MDSVTRVHQYWFWQLYCFAELLQFLQAKVLCQIALNASFAIWYAFGWPTIYVQPERPEIQCVLLGSIVLWAKLGASEVNVCLFVYELLNGCVYFFSCI